MPSVIAGAGNMAQRRDSLAGWGYLLQVGIIKS